MSTGPPLRGGARIGELGSTPEARAERRVGSVLRAKYVLDRVLGVGGMATVYLGVHRNGHRVAIKILHPEASADAATRERFLREGYVANSIGHPGAVRVVDDDIADDGAAFLVMELLVGETLHARAARLGGRLPLREVLALTHQLCDVLEAAHAHGVIHRDVKPENLFVTIERELKVLDFGIARRSGLGQLGTQSGEALGTPAYMPPEQALGHLDEVDARTDLWSVGATMFTLISGHLVHEGKTAGETFVAAATKPARSLAEVAPSAPREVVALVDRALRFHSAERWASAADLREAIAAASMAAFEEPIAARSIGPVTASAAPSSESGGPFSAATKRASSAPDVVVSPASPGAPSPLATTGRVSSTGEDPPVGAASTAPLRVSLPDAPTMAALETRSPDTKPSAVAEVASPRAKHGASGALLAAGAVAIALLAAFFLGATIAPSKRATGASTTSACVSNASCTRADAGAGNGAGPSICRQGACVALESEDCHVLAEPGDVANDATVWIGSMFPLRGASAEDLGGPSLDAIDLARRDFAETASGLPPVTPGGPRRPVAVVSCDDTTDAPRAARHLVEDVGVPVVLGFWRSKEVTDLASSIFTPRGVLALAANTAPALRAIPRAPGEPRLVLRTTSYTEMINAPEFALLAEVIEPAVRKAAGLRDDEPIRVASMRVANVSGIGRADDVVKRLRFNGRSVAENGESFREVVIPDVLDGEPRAKELDRAARELAAFRPHVVLANFGGELVERLEDAWPAGERSRPTYLGVAIRPDLTALVARRPEIRRRLFAADIATSTQALTKLVLRHNEIFPTRKVTAATSTPAPYDAFYVAAYAVAALGAEPVTGRAMARAIPRLLPPGERIDVGPAGIYQAFAALGAGRGIDLVGAATSLDFDPETGDAPADMAIFCYAPRADGSPLVIESGLVLRAGATKLEGTLRCP